MGPNWPRALGRRSDGQTMAEYAVVLTVIAVGLIAAFGAFSDRVTAMVNVVIGLMP